MNDCIDDGLFCMAARDGIVADVQKYLAEGGDINCRGTIEGWTALMCAARWGRVEMVKYLLERAANPNIHDSEGQTALSLAEKQNHTTVVELLRPVTIRDTADNTFRPCPLARPLERGDNEKVKQLIAQGANVNQMFTEGGWTRTPVIHAWNKKNDEMVVYLVEHGADVNIKDSDGDTILSLAMKDGNFKLVKFLFSNGGRIEFSTKDGKFTLQYPTSQEILQYLSTCLQIQQLVKPNSVSVMQFSDGKEPITRTTLGHLVAQGYFPGVKQFMENEKGDPNFPGPGGVTAFMLAVEVGSLKLFKYLHEHGGDINKVDDDGWSPLLYAATHGKVMIAKHLIKVGANINVVAKDGWTPVMVAANRGHLQVVEVLVEAGAKLNHFSETGHSELFAASPHPQIVSYLLSKGCDPNLTHPITRQTPLYFAAGHKAVETTKLLIASGAKVNVATKEGQTPLMVSVGNPSVFRMLLDAGADTSIIDMDGESVYDYARKPGASPEVADILKQHKR